MPIAGRTDGYKAGRGIPMIARVYKGAPRTDDSRRIPGELEHFRVEFEPAYEQFASAFAQMYGDKPKQIPGVLLLGAQPEDAFSTWFEEWKAGNKLVTRCTGETIIDAFNDATQRTDRGVNLPCRQGGTNPCQCKQVGRLTFMLPDFWRATGVIGSFMLVTHGWYDIDKIDATIKDTYSLFGNTLWKIPFVLFREPVEMAVPYKDASGEMKRTTKTFHMAQIRVQEGYTNTVLSLTDGEASPRQIDALTGEIDSAPALPSGTRDDDEGTPLFPDKKDADAFVKECQGRYKGLTGKKIADALGISQWTEFTGTLNEAYALVDAYVMG